MQCTVLAMHKASDGVPNVSCLMGIIIQISTTDYNSRPCLLTAKSGNLMRTTATNGTFRHYIVTNGSVYEGF